MELKPREMIELIYSSINMKEPLLIVGAPGIGKTDMVSQAAAAAGAETADRKGAPALLSILAAAILIALAVTVTFGQTNLLGHEIRHAKRTRRQR